MKKLLLILVAAFCFASCEETNTEMEDFLQGRWVQLNSAIDDDAKANALVLEFDGDDLTVKNGTSKTKPFGSGTSYWYYYVNLDECLVIYRDDYDDETYECYYLPINYDSEEEILYLDYDRTFGDDLHYSFMRR